MNLGNNNWVTFLYGNIEQGFIYHSSALLMNVPYVRTVKQYCITITIHSDGIQFMCAFCSHLIHFWLYIQGVHFMPWSTWPVFLAVGIVFGLYDLANEQDALHVITFLVFWDTLSVKSSLHWEVDCTEIWTIQLFYMNLF